MEESAYIFYHVQQEVSVFSILDSKYLFSWT